jgi:hypothetical protein
VGAQKTRLFVDADFGPLVRMYQNCTAASVMDFKPIEVAPDICLGFNGKVTRHRATVLPKSTGLFEEDVITRLPYLPCHIPSGEFSYATIGLGDCIFFFDHSFL